MYVVRKTLAVLLGCALVGVGINLFIVPHKLMDGGMIGIGLIAKYYLSWPPGLTILLASMPMYAMVYWHDKRLFYHSVCGLVLSSWFIDWLSPLRAFPPFSLPASSVIGGMVIGAGIGLMLAYDTNTGGTDLLAQFIAKRTDTPVALLIFLIDSMVVAGAYKAIGGYNTLYSAVTIASVAVFTHVFFQIGQGGRRQPYVVVGRWSDVSRHKRS